MWRGFSEKKNQLTLNGCLKMTGLFLTEAKDSDLTLFHSFHVPSQLSASIEIYSLYS